MKKTLSLIFDESNARNILKTIEYFAIVQPKLYR